LTEKYHKWRPYSMGNDWTPCQQVINYFIFISNYWGDQDSRHQSLFKRRITGSSGDIILLRYLKLMCLGEIVSFYGNVCICYVGT